MRSERTIGDSRRDAGDSIAPAPGRRGWRWLPVAGALAIVVVATLTPGGGASPDVTSTDARPMLLLRATCLQCRPAWLADLLANVALFVPLGVALAAAHAPSRPVAERRRRRLATAAGIAGATSLVIELLQLVGLPNGRTASLWDVGTNTMGALLGAWLVRELRSLATPAPRRAAAFSLGWTGVASATIVASGWALAMPPGQSTNGARGWQRSPLTFTPGYGWFAGEVRAARINGVSFQGRGTGPLIAQAPAAVSRVVTRLEVHGRDRRRGAVPMLYVHDSDWMRPLVLVGAMGDGFILQAARRAARLGLHSPSLALDRDSRAPAPPLATDGPMIVDARVTSTELALAWRTAGDSARATLPVTPTLGWTLPQTLIGASHRSAGLLTSCWLLLLLLPIGYWSWWSDRHRAAVALTGGIVCATALYASPRLFDVALVPGWQWAVASVALAAGLLLGSLSMARYDRTGLPAPIVPPEP